MMRESRPTGCGSLFFYLEDKLPYEITPETVETVVEELQDELDVLAFVQGAITPEDTVTIYTDADAAVKILKATYTPPAQESESKVDNFSIADDFEEETASEEELQGWHDRLVASALTFEFKGLAPKAVEALTNHHKAISDYSAESPEFAIALNTEIVAKSIVSVTTVDGKKRLRAWTPAEISALTGDLYTTESNKLFTTALNLSFLGNIFDQAVTAGFPS